MKYVFVHICVYLKIYFHTSCWHMNIFDGILVYISCRGTYLKPSEGIMLYGCGNKQISYWCQHHLEFKQSQRIVCFGPLSGTIHKYLAHNTTYGTLLWQLREIKTTFENYIEQTEFWDGTNITFMPVSWSLWDTWFPLPKHKRESTIFPSFASCISPFTAKNTGNYFGPFVYWH